MNSFFHATFSWLSVVVVSFKNSLIFTQDVTDASLNTCCKLKLVFFEIKASLVFGQTVFWNQSGILYQTESFLAACISLVHESNKPWSRQWPSCINSRKELRRNCSPIGHTNTKHFLCPIRSWHPLEFLEIARWESVPRGSFTRTWKLSSRPFSLPDWLPLGLRGWKMITQFWAYRR